MMDKRQQWDHIFNGWKRWTVVFALGIVTGWSVTALAGVPKAANPVTPETVNDSGYVQQASNWGGLGSLFSFKKANTEEKGDTEKRAQVASNDSEEVVDETSTSAVGQAEGTPQTVTPTVVQPTVVAQATPSMVTPITPVVQPEATTPADPNSVTLTRSQLEQLVKMAYQKGLNDAFWEDYNSYYGGNNNDGSNNDGSNNDGSNNDGSNSDGSNSDGSNNDGSNNDGNNNGDNGTPSGNNKDGLLGTVGNLVGSLTGGLTGGTSGGSSGGGLGAVGNLVGGLTGGLTGGSSGGGLGAVGNLVGGLTGGSSGLLGNLLK